ncbi:MULTISPECIES: sugar kinase [unclassified Rhizobium]|uniref:sugar kinase n=1 Tax=unclassified Rhizobium TaxID=2613769 RepID=UPI000EAA01B6|nr:MULTISPECIES: sugar kinase [unclassified Rhizobium]AYG70181.1 sugar kinase [Rhizobium sp. CCGE531]AYG76556.1 sugar kinase [Rhizobium sp. CCGE532]
MIEFASRKIVAIGEAMIEMAPDGANMFRFGYAGDTFNTAWHMAHLLGDAASVGFVSRVGVDGLSDRFVEELQADGFDTTVISRDPMRTMGLYVIELDGVERSFHYWRKDSAATHLADDAAQLSTAIDDAGLIHVSGITLAILSESGRHTLLESVARTRDAGAIVSFDPNVRPRLWTSPEHTRRSIEDMLTLSDIVLPSFDDEAALWGDKSPADTIARIEAEGRKEIIVKNGADAVTFASSNESGEMVTPKVAMIRDTTGAGDAFNAGYLAARIGGMALREAVIFGQQLSAEVLRHPGARAPKEALGRFTLHRDEKLGRIFACPRSATPE